MTWPMYWSLHDPTLVLPPCFPGPLFFKPSSSPSPFTISVLSTHIASLSKFCTALCSGSLTFLHPHTSDTRLVTYSVTVPALLFRYNYHTPVLPIHSTVLLGILKCDLRCRNNLWSHVCCLLLKARSKFRVQKLFLAQFAPPVPKEMKKLYLDSGMPTWRTW